MNPEPAPDRRIEIVHESLLTKWPRLVRWQAQDADGAQLRDELRQAAQIWNQHECTDDLLWTGTAFREYQLWHERYPGGLTETEEAFSKAMTAHAEKRRRIKRLVLATVISVLVTGLAIVGSFWQQAKVAEREAVEQTHRAEAVNLLSLARIKLEDHPSAAIAHALAGLELADLPTLRRLVVEALWRGPTELRLATRAYRGVDFSPDGKWLTTAGGDDYWKIWPADGGPSTIFEGSQVATYCEISPNGDLIAVVGADFLGVELWSLPGGRLLRTLDPLPGKTHSIQFSSDGSRLITSSEKLRQGQTGHVLVQSWPLEGGKPTLLARLETPAGAFISMAAVDPSESYLVWAHGRASPPLERLEEKPLIVKLAPSIGPGPVLWWGGFDTSGKLLYTIDRDQEWSGRLWSLAGRTPALLRNLGENLGYLRFDLSGSMIASPPWGSPTPRLWDLTAPPNAEPLRLERAGEAIEGDWEEWGQGLAFHPQGNWLATGHGNSVSFWPLTHTYPQVLRTEDTVRWLRFTPDGKGLISKAGDSIRLWPLDANSGARSRILFQAGQDENVGPRDLAPDGSFLVRGTSTGIAILPLNGGPTRELDGLDPDPTITLSTLAVGPRALRVAVGGVIRKPPRNESFVRVWDLSTGATQLVDSGIAGGIRNLWFTEEGHLLVQCGRERERVLRRWDLQVSPPRLLVEIDLDEGVIDSLSADGRQGIGWWGGDGAEIPWIYDLDTKSARRTRELSSHGRVNGRMIFDPTGEVVVTGSGIGGVQVSSVRGGEPHLLLGNDGGLSTLAVSPDGQWIASAGEDGTIRLWPMPDLSQPPLHTLARADLVAKLRSLTNLRAVRDADSDTGWKLIIGPFPGWEEAPTW